MDALIEGLLKEVWKKTLDVDIETPFLRMPFREAMDRFGRTSRTCVSPRSGLLGDFSSLRSRSSPRYGGKRRRGQGLQRQGAGRPHPRRTQAFEDAAKSLGAKGLAFIKSENGEWKSPILKFFSEGEQNALRDKRKVEEGDAVFFAAGPWKSSCNILGRVRLESAVMLEKALAGSNVPPPTEVFWVIDFPS